MRTTFTPDYLARAAEHLGWDDTAAGQAKRTEDLALLQELMAATRAATAPGPQEAGARGCALGLGREADRKL